jgi:5-(carboxyamino)imidazole ribonucleotide mutase
LAVNGTIHSDRSLRDAGALLSHSPDSIPVALVMGSRSDWETMKAASEVLDEFRVPHHVQVVSAHRTPDLLFQFAEAAQQRGFRLIIAGAGGAAHLPGMLAAKTPLPVLGVPVQSKALNGLDSLLSIVQMPKGVPVPTFAIGAAGAANAALSAVAILALSDPALASRLAAWREQQSAAVLANPDPREPAR